MAAPQMQERSKMCLNLSIMLREGTKASHRAAEKTPFMQAFLARRISLEAYGTLLARLYPVYAALERCHKQHKEHPILKRVYYPQLLRTVALKHDLAYYLGDEYSAQLQPTPAVQRYVERIRWLASHHPEGIVAHHYTRYLGDLSGGQILKRLVIKMFDLPLGQGTAFYEFDDIANIKQFKQQYRAQLNTIPINEEKAHRLVAEANLAFQLNINLFRELGDW